MQYSECPTCNNDDTDDADDCFRNDRSSDELYNNTEQQESCTNDETDLLLDHRWYNIVIETNRNILQVFFDSHTHYVEFVQHLKGLNLV